MKTRVLDSWAILEWIQASRPAGKRVADLLAAAEKGAARLLMSEINAGEVYYFLRKQHSEELSESWRLAAPTLPVQFDVPSSDDIWQAASLKGLFPIAYADAFAAALALKHACPLVTGDPELRSVENLKLDWIG